MKKKLIITFSIIGAIFLVAVLIIPIVNSKKANLANRSTNYDNNQEQSNESDAPSGFTRYSNTDYFYLPDAKIFVKGTSKVKSFEGQNFSNNLIFAGNRGCIKTYSSVDDFSKSAISNLTKDNSYNTIIYSGSNTCGSDLDTLWKVSQYVTFDVTACFINFNGHCSSIDMDTYTYPMIVYTGPIYIFYKDAEIYYDTDNDGYGDTLTTGVYISSIKHYNENVGQLLEDGTIIFNDPKIENKDNDPDDYSNTSNNNVNNSNNYNNDISTNDSTNINKNNIGNGNTTNDNSVNNSTNNNNSNETNTAKPKLNTYKLVFNNFDKYYKDNFGEDGYTRNSTIKFYINGQCVTDTKVDDIELRPAGSYYISSTELKGIVCIDLYIDDKKADTITVNVDEKSQANVIYMD